MSEKIVVKKYIPEVAPSNLKWFERDWLLIYIDHLKYERFISDLDKYLEKAEVMNFEMIHNRCRGNPRIFPNKNYQTVVNSDVKKLSQKEIEKTAGACLHTERKDIFISFFR